MSLAPRRTPRNYLITGASSGIGAELARQLGARGDRLALVARREERLEEVAAAAVGAAEENGHADPFEPLVLPADVTDEETFREAVEKADERLPDGIEVVVLNAGINWEVAGDRYDGEAAATVVEVNLVANARALGWILPRMVERDRGLVVGVSSVAGERGLPENGPYCASKAGLTTLLESLRVDLRETGVDVTTVKPGFVRSELTEENDYWMPFLMNTDDAVRCMIRGMDRRKRQVWFPLRLALLIWFVSALPDVLYDAFAGLVRRNALPDPDEAGEGDADGDSA